MKPLRALQRLHPTDIRGRLTLAATIIIAIPLIAGAIAAALLIRQSLTDNTLLEAQKGCTEKVFTTYRNAYKEAVLCFSPWIFDEDIIQKLHTNPPSTVLHTNSPPIVLIDPFKDRIPGGLTLSLWPFSNPEISEAARSDDKAVARLILNSPSFTGNQRILNLVIFSLAGGLTVLLGVFATTTWFILGRVLRPVEGIRRTVAEITEHDLTRRVPVPRTKDEIARLATTMNRTLSRLHEAVESNRRFAADASHELRSPIAALRTELEIAQAHPDQAHWRQVIDNALSDTQRLQDLASDLLLLTRLDSAGMNLDDTIDLSTLVTTETDRAVPAHLTLTVDTDRVPAYVRGRHTLLTRLLGNLLDNAERHAAHAITVHLTTANSTAVLEVGNDGPAIPITDLDRIFDRFTRLDDTRTRDTGGTGLGLSIARRIATAHHGTLHATNTPHGVCFTTHIPLATTGDWTVPDLADS